jgi:hypothetical protein
MIALRQIKRVPKNHIIVIEVPDTIQENQIMEVILLCKEIIHPRGRCLFKQRGTRIAKQRKSSYPGSDQRNTLIFIQHRSNNRCY